MKVKFHFIVFFISIGFTSLSQINFNESFLNNNQNNLKTAYFASGCFWCVEAIFENVNGVVEVLSGYSGGTTVKPSYKQIMTGKTGHAETTKIVYNPKLVAFKTLVDVFFWFTRSNDFESSGT
jgi:peptide-methionine (S)-S-oxide reductase